MSSTTMVHVRIDDVTKARAAETLAEMGLSISDAVRVFLKRVVADKQLPFDVRAPNSETLEAMAEADEIIKTKKARFASAQELIDDLEKISRK